MRIKLCGLIVWAAMLAAGFVSCQQHDDIPQGVKYPILFDSSDTRATANLDSLVANGFKVYAYFKGNTENSHTFDKDVYYDATNRVWTYDKLEYWIPGAQYWFRAFYPKSGYTLNVNTTTSDLSYTIEDFDITSQLDLMDAEATASVTAGATAPKDGSVVKFSFNHLLACVAIELKSEIANVTVSEISLEDIAQTGNYSNGTWTSEQTATINKQYSGEALVKDATDFVDVTDGGFLVIPESIGGKQRLIIRTSHKDYEVVIPVITWELGKKYTYTLTIKQENIEFNEPGVDIWDEENATGSVVIK